MKAMILAAGRGERLRPLTDKTPKPLLEVGGRALIEHQLGWLYGAGVREVVINVHHLAGLIREKLGRGERYGLRIDYSAEDRPLETGGGVKKALPLLGEAPFIVLSGDVWIDYPLAELPAAPPPGSLGLLVMVDNPGHHPDGDFGLGATGLLETTGPKYTYSGVGLLTPALVRDEPGEVFRLRRAWDRQIPRRRLHGVLHHGYWCDLGSAERLAALRQRLAAG